MRFYITLTPGRQCCKTLIYCHSTETPSFCVIKQYFDGTYHGIAVSNTRVIYHGILTLEITGIFKTLAVNYHSIWALGKVRVFIAVIYRGIFITMAPGTASWPSSSIPMPEGLRSAAPFGHRRDGAVSWRRPKMRCFSSGKRRRLQNFESRLSPTWNSTHPYTLKFSFKLSLQKRFFKTRGRYELPVPLFYRGTANLGTSYIITAGVTSSSKDTPFWEWTWKV